MDPVKMYFLLKMGIFHGYVSLPEGNIFSHLKIGLLPQKEKIVFQPSIFRCYVRLRKGNFDIYIYILYIYIYIIYIIYI